MKQHRTSSVYSHLLSVAVPLGVVVYRVLLTCFPELIELAAVDYFIRTS